MFDTEEDHPHALEADLQALERTLERRDLLKLLAGVSLMPFVACAVGSSTTHSDGGTATVTPLPDGGVEVSNCSTIPEETAGPYPGDGSNGANALSESGIVRSDIRSSFGSASGLAAGIPLTVTLTLVNASGSCESLEGYAIYIWHCDRDGKYSLYSQGVTQENYLRGVQATNTSGQVTFQTIFPACYSGRWPHIHFEIYPSVSVAILSRNKVATSQMAMPQAACNDVYATTGYSASISNLSQVSLSSDMVFSDGATLQLPSMTGNVTDGYTASLVVGISV